MKRVSLYAILALCAVAFTGRVTAQEAKPKAVVAEPIFDAGEVQKGLTLSHDFTIRNEGNAPLHISDVRSSCGCTVAEYDKVIAPGASGTVHAVMDTTDLAGAISKGIGVYTDDPDNPNVVLTIKVTVQPSIFIRPGYARFIQPQMSDPGVVRELVFTNSFEDLELLDVKSPYPFLKVDYRPATEEERDTNGKGKQWVLTLTLDYEKAPVGALAEYVRMTTNHPAQKEAQVAISGFVRPFVVVTPSEADFGEVKISAEGARATFRLKNYAQQNLEVNVQAVTVPGVAVEVDPVTEGREFNLVVTLGPDIPMGDFSGAIKLGINHPKMKTLEIPLKGHRI